MAKAFNGSQHLVVPSTQVHSIEPSVSVKLVTPRNVRLAAVLAIIQTKKFIE